MRPVPVFPYIFLVSELEISIEFFTTLIFLRLKLKSLLYNFVRSSTCSTGEIFNDDSNQ